MDRDATFDTITKAMLRVELRVVNEYGSKRWVWWLQRKLTRVECVSTSYMTRASAVLAARHFISNMLTGNTEDAT